jgi:hypothetical protein
MSRLRRDDGGQITTALVIVGTVLVVALGLLVTRLGQATDQKSQVQTAADAAALAGAQQIRHDAPIEILRAIRARERGDFGCGMGREKASELANRGGASLVQYCYSPGDDTVSVLVDSLANSASGSPAKAGAVSRVGLALGFCTVPAPPPPPPPPSPTQTPTPPPTPTPTPTPTLTQTPPPDVADVVQCGAVLIPIVFDGASGDLRIGLSVSEIRDLFPTPALKS